MLTLFVLQYFPKGKHFKNELGRYDWTRAVFYLYQSAGK